MMKRILDFLLPRERKFIDMLMAQSDILYQGADEFNNFVTNFDKLKEAEILEKRSVIKEIEHKGDDITRSISDGLHETFITPFDREDILDLTQKMDDILDFIHHTATRIAVYKIRQMPADMTKFSRHILECCTIIKNSMHNLKNYAEIKKAIISLHNIEVEADKLFFSCVEEIFENNHDTKELIKFKEIYESVEEAINMCDEVGDTLGAIVIKHG
jgi:predicted phosphate transport protein (TIGR00153 family)